MTQCYVPLLLLINSFVPKQENSFPNETSKIVFISSSLIFQIVHLAFPFGTKFSMNSVSKAKRLSFEIESFKKY